MKNRNFNPYLAFMQKIWAILILCSFSSCDLFQSKDAKTQELINQEMLNIDWNDVDNYPLFENCDETLTKTGQRECFESELLGHFSAILREFEFVLDEDIDSTVYVDFSIDKDGRISVLNIEKDKAINLQMPEFDGIIIQSLKGLSPIAPALKRGIPVKAKFRIPIVLNSGLVRQ
ncbi:MAG: hypothetical protein QM485_12530 [Flavobacteriaceae bacterium]